MGKYTVRAVRCQQACLPLLVATEFAINLSMNSSYPDIVIS